MASEFLIDPIYAQSRPNEEIDLGTHYVHIANNGTEHISQARALMMFAPKERLRFVVPVTEENHSLSFRLPFNDQWNGKLALGGRNVSLDVHWRGSGNEFGGIAFEPKTSVVTPTATTTSIKSVTFHLFNFPDFWRSEVFVPNGEQS
ncbi:MAG: hypothetical protein ACKV2Q_00200 [Planctomycetaceae bacterium]